MIASAVPGFDAAGLASAFDGMLSEEQQELLSAGWTLSELENGNARMRSPRSTLAGAAGGVHMWVKPDGSRSFGRPGGVR